MLRWRQHYPKSYGALVQCLSRCRGMATLPQVLRGVGAMPCIATSAQLTGSLFQLLLHFGAGNSFAAAAVSWNE